MTTVVLKEAEPLAAAFFPRTFLLRPRRDLERVTTVNLSSPRVGFMTFRRFLLFHVR